MRICNIVVSTCVLAAVACVASANITSASGTSGVWVNGGGQSDGVLASISYIDMSLPGTSPVWGGQASYGSWCVGDWSPPMSVSYFTASGSADRWGEAPVGVGASLHMSFTFDAPGYVSLVTSGAGSAQLHGYGSVSGNSAWSGWLTAGQYSLDASTDGPGSFTVIVPSIGGASLTAVCGLCAFTRRRRAAMFAS